MYNNRVRNIELPENLFSNLGEIRSKELELEKRQALNAEDAKVELPELPEISDYQAEFNPSVKFNYSNKKEYRDRITRMYDEVKGIIPIDNEVDSVLYFNNYVEKGIVVRPKAASLKQFWTEYRLIDNEKKQAGQSMTSTPLITPQPLEVVDAKPIKDIGNEKEIDSFEQLFEALSSRISEINSYIDELKEMKNSIDKTRRKLETDREKLASERSEFNTYKQKEESKLNKEKENLKINFNRLQTIIDDLDKKLVSIDTEE